MFEPIVALQSSSDLGFALGTLVVAHLCQHVGFVFARDNGADDVQTSDACDITDDLDQ